MKSMKSFFVVLTLMFLQTGCSLFDLDSSSEGHSATVVVELEEGETRSLPPFQASLTYAEKLEDSRCPLNVDCIWEGQASVLLKYDPVNGDPVEITLTGYVPPNEDSEVTVETLGLRFTLLRLAPYPVDGQPNGDPSRATIRVEEL